MKTSIKKKKWIISVAVFLLLIVMINSLLNYLLYLPGLSRVIFHESEAGEYDCIVLGASHGSYGYDPVELECKTGLKTMNMCMGWEYYNDAYYVLKYALKNNKPKLVVLDVDYQYLINTHKESILYNNVYNAYPNCLEKIGYFFSRMADVEYRGSMLKWTNYFWQNKGKINKVVGLKQSQAYKNYEYSMIGMNPYDTFKGNGFIYRNSDYVKATTECLEWNESKVDEEQVESIGDIVELCREHDIDIVFTSVTQDPEMIAKQSQQFADADTYIQAIADDLSVDYLNFNKLDFDAFPRNTTDFYDREGHMYGSTAEAFCIVAGEILAKRADDTLKKEQYFDSSIMNLYKDVEQTWQ